METIGTKIRTVFSDLAVCKNKNNYNVFSGRNLPSFVKDFLIKKHIDEQGNVDKNAILKFLDTHLPKSGSDILKSLQTKQETVTILTRFIVVTDLNQDKMRFAIPDLGIKSSNGIIPKYIASKHEELKDGEIWGVVTLCYAPPMGKEKGYVEMIKFNPFKPYTVDLEYFKSCRKQFDISEWIDVLLSAMEYNPKGFQSINQKIEFLSRLLPFVETNLNLIELAPKGTGKSYVFNNLSKYGWMIAGGKVTRAKLLFDKSRQAKGIISMYDFVAMDEIQTIVFQESSELQSALKTYLEAGKTSVDNVEIISECGLILLGNIPLSSDNQPLSHRYFDTLPSDFKESALLDRFHGFISGWFLPRLNDKMLLNDWSINVEYFSEILHSLRYRSEYQVVLNEVIISESGSDLRDIKAVTKLASAYMKLFFPHVRSRVDISNEDLWTYCIAPAIEKRGIIRKQMHIIDSEYKENMPHISLNDSSALPNKETDLFK